MKSKLLRDETAAAAELLAELSLLNEAQPDVLEPGEHTAQEWAAKWNRARSTADCLLKSGVKHGKLVSRSVVVKVNGHNRRATVYKVKP